MKINSPHYQKCPKCDRNRELIATFQPMTIPIPEMESLIDKWGRENWYINLERDDLSEEQHKELESLAYYDQLLNTISKVKMCVSCIKEVDAEFDKYYN